MKHGCSLFVGNIDFGVEEQSVIKELSAAGRVVSFRMVYDKNTGKPKGYGFCEYESPLIAETAMKTLKISFNGRPLKINYAENDIPHKPREAPVKSLQLENIIAVLDSSDDENLREVINYLKRMALDQPTRLKELLENNPNLLVALMTILIRLKCIDESKFVNLLKESFDIAELKDQITSRIKYISDSELNSMAEDVKYRINRMKNMIEKKEKTINTTDSTADDLKSQTN